MQIFGKFAVRRKCDGSVNDFLYVISAQLQWGAQTKMKVRDNYSFRLGKRAKCSPSLFFLYFRKFIMLFKTAHYKYRYFKGPHRFSPSKSNLRYPCCYLHSGGFSINGTKCRLCSFWVGDIYGVNLWRLGNVHMRKQLSDERMINPSFCINVYIFSN